MKRYPQRVPKDYRWVANTEGGAFDDATILIAPLLPPSLWTQNGSTKAHCNLKRGLVDIVYQIADVGLSDPDAGIWGPVSWMLLLVDQDDDSIYDPDNDLVLTQETVLAHGLEDSIGWGTISSAFVSGTGTQRSQSAAFMASRRIRVDMRSNRRITTDQRIVLYITRSTINTELNSEGSVNYELAVQGRWLLQFP